jgi:pheromone alpha factor receptor
MNDEAAMSATMNPFTQGVNVVAPDGSTVTLKMDDFDRLRLYGCRLAISYGTQIGASFLLLLVLLLLTRAEKRKSSIFLINGLCLLTNAIRCVLLSCFVTSTWWNPYAQLLSYYEGVSTRDKATLVAMNTFTLIVTVLVMMSLSLQVYVVCITTAPKQRFVIMGVTTLMACVATGYKFAFVVLSTRANLRLETFDSDVVLTSYVTQAVSIWLFSCVFTYKLGHAIVQRRKLKMPQFGPMQIVFIMGCQTLIIPGTFDPFPSSPPSHSYPTPLNSSSH